MLLAMDVGNTQTVVGLYGREPAKPGRQPADDLLHHWRLSTNTERTSDELALLVFQLLDHHGFDAETCLDGISVSSGVPRVTAGLRAMGEDWFGFPPLVIEPGIRTGMPILYDNPKDVGADRIADAVAAFDLFGGPTIVVDFGTATTIEAVSDKGEYLGGAIVPGIEISLDALFNRAAALRRVELIEPRNVIGKNTIEAIQSGAVYGFAAQVDGLCTRFEAELGGGPCTIVATGGLSDLITPLSAKINHLEPWLTLHGLRLVYERNQ